MDTVNALWTSFLARLNRQVLWILVTLGLCFIGVDTFYDIVSDYHHKEMMFRDKLNIQARFIQDRVKEDVRKIDFILDQMGADYRGQRNYCNSQSSKRFTKFLQEMAILSIASRFDRILCVQPPGSADLLGNELSNELDIAEGANNSLVPSILSILPSKANADHPRPIIFYKVHRQTNRQGIFVTSAQMDTKYFDRLVESAIDDYQADQGIIGLVLLTGEEINGTSIKKDMDDSLTDLLRQSVVLGMHGHDSNTQLDLNRNSRLDTIFNNNTSRISKVMEVVLPENSYRPPIKIVATGDLAPLHAAWRKGALAKLLIFGVAASAIIVLALVVARNARSLRKALQEAQSANSARGKFLSQMSHELRTPLNAILGYGDLLGHLVKVQEQEEMAGQIVKSGQHLLTLIDDLLDFSVVDSGKYALNISDISLKKLFDDCKAFVLPLAKANKTIIEFDVDQSIIVRGDHQRLRQILLNFMSNAIKYGRRPGKLLLVAWRNSEGVCIAVRDDGPGIPSALQDQLFVPFNRLLAASTNVPGVGLGLAICKQLAEAMGGRVGVDSKEGEGSSFWVVLPAAESHLGVLKASATTTVTSPSSVTGKVLYVEDNEVNTLLIKKLFEQYMPKVVLDIARDGAEACVKALSFVPDILLLDMNLPDTDGVALLNKLRSIGVQAPAYALTADALPQDRDKALAAGFVAYLTKPVRVSELQAYIENGLFEC